MIGHLIPALISVTPQTRPRQVGELRVQVFPLQLVVGPVGREGAVGPGGGRGHAAAVVAVAAVVAAAPVVIVVIVVVVVTVMAVAVDGPVGGSVLPGIMGVGNYTRQSSLSKETQHSARYRFLRTRQRTW